MSAPLVIGIESTCDETGVAFVRGHDLLSDVTATSMEQHARYGGIIPEIASRAHLEALLPTLREAASKAGVTLEQVDAVAVAGGPGLVGSLSVGISAAKALAIALDKPFYAVNHVIGHLAVDQLVDGEFPERFIGLIVSGGHSNLVLVRDIARDIVELGGTLDDAAGEAFDKVGRLLHTPYPGGPHVDRLASQGNKKAIRFPRGLANGKDRERYRYDFSFSGLKTAVARYIEGLESRGESINKEDICAGFSEAINDSLTAKAIQAALDHDCKTIVVGGGFSANSRLRELLAERAQAAGIEVRLPPLRFCTDNGAQIATLGANLLAANCPPSPLDISPDSAMSLSQSYIAPTRAVGTNLDDDLMGRVKENLERGLDHMRPYMEQASEKMKPYAEQVTEKVKPYMEQASEKMRPYAEQVSEHMRPYVEQASEKVKPYVEQASERVKPYAEQVTEKVKPYVEQASEKVKPYVEQASEYAHKQFEHATEKVRSYRHNYLDFPQEEAKPDPDRE